ncbi:IS66 family transposase, partial [Pantoea endophytica]
MKPDDLLTTQNPDELRELAQRLLAEQVARITTLEARNTRHEQRITAQDLHITTLEALRADSEIRIGALEALRAQHEARIRDLEEQLKLAQQWRFGRRSEKLPASQKPLSDEDSSADEAGIRRVLRDLLSGRDEPKAKPARQALPASLPRETVTLMPDAACCPDCGGDLRPLRDEVSEKLAYSPARFTVKRTVRPQLSCGACGTVQSAALPPSLIEKGAPDASLVAQVIIAKVLDHLPLHRQQKMYAREGVSLPVSTLSGWFGEAGACLAPLAAALREDLRQQRVIHADETPLQVLDTRKGKAVNGYLWTYVSAAGSDREVVVYDCRPGRSGEYARAMLSGWSGTLVVDGYAGYSALLREGADAEGNAVPSAIREAGCWSHVRRKFMELYKMNESPGAKAALEQIRWLYQLERKIKARPAAQKRRWRQRYAKPHLATFHSWLLATQSQSSPGGALHKAITYALKRWASLTTYLDDGMVPPDNNRCEQMIRPVAVGRRNWLFAGSLRGGERLEDLLTLIHTARLNGLEPQAWLCDV